MDRHISALALTTLLLLAGCTAETEPSPSPALPAWTSDPDAGSVTGTTGQFHIQLAEGTELYSQDPDSTTAHLSFAVTAPDGTWLQTLTCDTFLSGAVTLEQLVQDPAAYFSLDDQNGDGLPDLRLVGSQLREETLYAVFLWDPRLERLVPDPATANAFPDQERLSCLAQNREFWIRLGDSSTGSGTSYSFIADLSFLVYRQSGELVQQIDCTSTLKTGTSLLDIVRHPASYVALEDVNGDGVDDLRITLDNIREEAAYQDYLWDAAAGLFVEES